MTKPQGKYWEWRDKNGLTYSGADVAQGDTVQQHESKKTQTEELLHIGLALAYLNRETAKDQGK